MNPYTHRTRLIIKYCLLCVEDNIEICGTTILSFCHDNEASLYAREFDESIEAMLLTLKKQYSSLKLDLKKDENSNYFSLVSSNGNPLRFSVFSVVKEFVTVI